MSDKASNVTSAAASVGESGPWDPALATLREWDPAWAETCVKMTTNPWTSGVLPRKFIELVSIGAQCRMHLPQPRRHAPPHPRRARGGSDPRRDSLRARVRGAHVDPFVQPRRSHPSGRSQSGECATGSQANTEPTPACDAMREIGQWNTAWDPFFALDPLFTDEFMAMGASIYKSGIMSPKEVELLSIASMRPSPTCMRPARDAISKTR